MLAAQSGHLYLSNFSRLNTARCIGLSPLLTAKQASSSHRKMKSFASMALGCGPGATMSECDSQPKSQKKHESLFHVAC